MSINFPMTGSPKMKVDIEKNENRIWLIVAQASTSCLFSILRSG